MKSIYEKTTVGPHLKKRRKLLGMSQEYVSGISEMTQAGYSKFERGMTTISFDTYFKILRALRINVFFVEMDEEPAKDEV